MLQRITYHKLKAGFSCTCSNAFELNVVNWCCIDTHPDYKVQSLLDRSVFQGMNCISRYELQVSKVASKVRCSSFLSVVDFQKQNTKALLYIFIDSVERSTKEKQRYSFSVDISVTMNLNTNPGLKAHPAPLVP